MTRFILAVALCLALVRTTLAQSPPLRPLPPLSAAEPTSQPAAKGLHFAAGPPDGSDLAANGALRSSRGGPPITSLVVLPPLPEYNLTARQTGGLENATGGTQFRYLVTSGGKQIVAVTVAPDATRGGFHATRMGLAPRVDQAQAIARLIELPEVRAGSYEPRYLSIRANSLFEVIWLKADAGGKDLFFPFADYYNHGIQPEKLYAPDEILDILVPARTGKPPALLGTVVGDNGQPVAKATVTVTDFSYKELAHILTDDQGAFALEVPSTLPPQSLGNIILNARFNDLVSAREMQFLSVGVRQQLRAPIQLLHASTISGTVIDPDGKPVPHAKLAYGEPAVNVNQWAHNLRLSADGAFVEMLVAGATDDHGTITIPGVCPGKFIVAASTRAADGTVQIGFLQPVDVKAGTPTELPHPIKLIPTGSLAGAVVDAEGKPVGNVEITYTGVCPPNWPDTTAANVNGTVSPAHTDAAGAFILPALPPGTYEVTASIPTSPNRVNRATVTAVEIKPATPTKLPTPLTLTPATINRGGGGYGGGG